MNHARLPAVYARLPAVQLPRRLRPFANTTVGPFNFGLKPRSVASRWHGKFLAMLSMHPLWDTRFSVPMKSSMEPVAHLKIPIPILALDGCGPVAGMIQPPNIQTI